MVDRAIFTPERMPIIDPAEVGTLTRWHTEQWVRLGNYIIALERHVADLEARISALEP